MNLNNVQYDKIQREYSSIRFDNLAEEDYRRNLIYREIPGFKELDASVTELSMHYGREFLSGDSSAMDTLRSKLAEVKSRKRSILVENGYPANYLDPIYTCALCQDTGLIKDSSGSSKKCRCLKNKEIAILYDQSNIRELIKRENFSTLSTEYQTGEDKKHFEGALKVCKDFVENFNVTKSNILLFGAVGTGKSFLSGCVANELLKKGHSVLYFSAVTFFAKISEYTFGGREKFENSGIYEDLKSCDLLIIDDLGTEMTNSFVVSSLLDIINERQINQKSTIISTNLDLKQIEMQYTTRVFSRIISNYNLCKLTGNDIRLIKKRSEMNQTN